MPLFGAPIRIHEFSTHWKNRERFPDEKFVVVRDISILYPQYNKEMLEQHFKRKRKFEDEEVIIRRTRIIHEPSDDVPKPIFDKRMFWEFDYDDIDWPRAYRTVIHRVLERGKEKDWENLISYYGLPKVINCIRSEIQYMPDYIIDNVCKYFDLKHKELLCWIRKQSMPKTWI